jgi:RNA polymerase sporulation-specific sigma factor
VYIAKKFENINTDIEDIISIGTIGLMKAVNTYNPEKNIKLATYASRCIENEILMYVRKNSGSRCEISIDEPLNTDWDGNELLLSDILSSDDEQVYSELESEDEKKTIRNALYVLSKREREIIMLRFGLDGSNKELTQKEVADLLGISQSYISRLEKKIMQRLKKEIENKI